MPYTKKNKPTYSIVIPTYKRIETLIMAVDAVFSTANSEIIEIVVVDDSEGKEVLSKKIFADKKYRNKVAVLASGHHGAAAARNTGILHAKGDIIIFLDDDILVAPGSLQKHIEFHIKHTDIYDVMVGRVLLDTTRQSPNDLTAYLHEYAYQFATPAEEKYADFRYFYTCNMSAKKQFLLQGGMFDETFSKAVYDDLEFGYRLEKTGMRLTYNKDCVAYHLKNYTLPELFVRYTNMGVYAKKLAYKHPELKNDFIVLSPRLSEKLYMYAYPLLWIVRFFPFAFAKHLYYRSCIITAFFRGIYD